MGWWDNNYPWVMTAGGLLGAAAGIYLFTPEWLPEAAFEALESLKVVVSPNKRKRAAEAASLVDQYRAAVPFGLAMAIAEHESGFNPLALNPKTNASGIYQIVEAFWSDYGVSGSDAATRTGPAFELEPNIRGGLRYLNRCWETVQSMAPGMPQLEQYACVYYGIAEGRGNLQKALRAAAEEPGGPRWEGVKRARTTYNRTGGMWATAQSANYWETQRDSLLAGEV